MEEKYLPVGSVVRLKEGKKNLMVIGFMSSTPQTANKIYDYIGALYPEGVLSSDMNFVFDHENIEEVLFKGFVNDEEVTFKRRLVEFSTNGTIDGQPVDMNAVNEQMAATNMQNNVSPAQNNIPSQPQMFTNSNPQ